MPNIGIASVTKLAPSAWPDHEGIKPKYGSDIILFIDKIIKIIPATPAIVFLPDFVIELLLMDNVFLLNNIPEFLD